MRDFVTLTIEPMIARCQNILCYFHSENIVSDVNFNPIFAVEDLW